MDIEQLKDVDNKDIQKLPKINPKNLSVHDSNPEELKIHVKKIGQRMF